MEISNKTIEYLENLSKLKLTSDERAKSIEDISKIISFMDELSAINTDSVPYEAEACSNLREDIVTNAIDLSRRDELISNSSNKQDGAFVVTKVVN